MSGPRVAIVGMACRYPDVSSPAELWENVLAGRRAFRRLPDSRMRLDDYWSPDPQAPDRFYSQKAAVLEGYEFDRIRFKIAGSTYRSTDLTHWLALDTAAKALADAGFPDGEGLPRTTTSVIVGNTLAGEFSRANLMRLRWPYVRRTVAAALREQQGWEGERLAEFLDELEVRYKAPFPPVDEDTLAGGLANTIAGRICNYFDFRGGGYTVDGACSSSLLSVATACAALCDGHVDAAVAGGVDLSIDPFETIGFAKTGALATTDMRVYDQHSNGFWPGEGCGMLVLLREQDALARGLRAYGVIVGWGQSSDGKGGITRPEAGGHRLAIRRAYERAGFDVGTVSYFEGHGTGTAVGDATELRAFAEARREARADAAPAAISTVKANFGHTKAAAGVAGLIKATLAVHHQVIPPASGHVDPHPELTGQNPALRVPAAAELWPAGEPIRAGVSSMGFGGINAHVIVENPGAPRRTSVDAGTRRLVRSRQDCELLLLDAPSAADLRERVARLAPLCSRLSFAELGDLAATLHRDLGERAVRAAVVAATPEDAERRLAALMAKLDDGAESVIDPEGVFLGTIQTAPRIGFLFPGQGSGRRNDGGALRKRFGLVDELYQSAGLPVDGDQVATAVAQPRIVTSSIAGLRVLSLLGIDAVGVAGHSLGELTSLHWAGAMDEPTLMRLAATRGRVMAHASHGDGTMASIGASPDVVENLLAGEPVVIAGFNSPRQTVVSGPVGAVDLVCRRAARGGLVVSRISVSHAFHSPAVAPAAEEFGGLLGREQFGPLCRRMVSTVTGDVLPADIDVRALLTRQILEPVRFAEAVSTLLDGADLLIEVGPGKVLSGLAADIAPGAIAMPMEADSVSLAGLLRVVGTAYVLGAPVRHGELFADRFVRSLPLDKEFNFLQNPCESAPVVTISDTRRNSAGPAGPGGQAGPALAAASAPANAPSGSGPDRDSLEVLRRLAAERAELPLEAVRADTLPLDELHLSSITVGQIMNQAVQELDLAVPVVTSAFATSTLAELAQMLDDLAATGLADDAESSRRVQGVAPWVRAFTVELVRTPRPAASTGADGSWTLFASEGHPLAVPLHEALRQAKVGDGVLLCLPDDCGEQHVPLMLEAAHAVLARQGPARFVVVQDGPGAAALAKSLHLEAPAIATTVISLPLAQEMSRQAVTAAIREIVADVAATAAFSEVSYDHLGVRRVPVLRPLPDSGDPPAGPPLGPDDVLLVTGGGKGITAECALALASDTGAAVALLGRSDPESDAELSANLDRMAAAGLTFRYVRADITRADEVRSAVDEIAQALGPVTAVLHGAGRNEPAALSSLDETTFLGTLAPKLSGLEAVLAATDPASLRLLVSFGSIIGRAGLRGEAHYATANDWLTEATRRTQRTHPACRCVAFEWSVWSGVGMGERLGVLESLMREGITPVTADEGVAMLRRVLADPQSPTAVVVMGRAEGLPTITLERRELPLLRFVDRPRVYYPDIELVADAELSSGSDPYLGDHLLDGDLLFPAVLGMEAMAQVATALTGLPGVPVLEELELLRPIVVPVGGSTTIRVAALSLGKGVVDVAIRSSETGFQAEHFRATLRYPRGEIPEPGRPPTAEHLPMVPLDPPRDLYGGILFQGKRFQRLTCYLELASKHCAAKISNEPDDPWFGVFLPADLVLGDPGTRDSVMHAIQACVPNATLLPAGVDRLYLAEPDYELKRVFLNATERYSDGDNYVYDVEVRDPAGRLVERWDGLRLRAVRKTDGSGPWVPALLGPYLERQVADLLPLAPACVLEPAEADGTPGQDERRARTTLAVSRMLGKRATVRHRPDGKPEVDGVDGDIGVSSAHTGRLTFAVMGTGQVACDVETARDRVAGEWEALLGAEQFALAQLIARERDEPFSLAGTRVWGALECLRKTGRARAEPVTFARARPDGWVLLSYGRTQIATFSTRIAGAAEPIVFAILKEGGR